PALASAINNGQSISRGASQIVVAAAGVGTTAPTQNTKVTLAGGTDGASGVTAQTLVGTDTTPRSGMFALRSVGCSVAALCDCTDDTTNATQIAFGLSEGVLMIGVGTPGESLTTAVSARNDGGIDSYAFERLVGDWILFYDEANGLNRYVSPQAFELGKLVNLAPQFTTLNKPMQGIIGTQRSATGATYSDAELQLLGSNGLSLICNPIPAGKVFGNRFGRNTSSNVGIHQVAYTRLTNYIAKTLDAGMGKYVGELQSRQADDSTRARASATLNAFLGSLQGEKMIDDFQVICDLSNNPVNRIAAGYLKAAVKVVYLAVVEYFLIDIEGGQTVQITRTQNQPTGFNFAVITTSLAA
ncbi:phage tail sheath C-terminal domain-containing protein, partial [Methylobacterium haplocladii]